MWSGAGEGEESEGNGRSQDRSGPQNPICSKTNAMQREYVKKE